MYGFEKMIRSKSVTSLNDWRRTMNNTEIKTKLERSSILWMHEAITYLGLDRLGLARPDKAMYRLVSKGALHPIKIAGHLAFNKAELDIVAANGDQKRGKGRPRKTLSCTNSAQKQITLIQ